jgi:4-oxalocrotonate tautomerase
MEMPLAQIKGISGVLTLEQKQEMIKKVTEAIISVEGEGVRPVTWVVVEDVPSGQWGVGGDLVTTSAVQEMIEAKK